MLSLTMRQRIIATFAIIFAMMIGAAGFAYIELTRAQSEATSVKTDSLPSLYASDQILVRLVTNFALAETGLADESRFAGQGGDPRLATDRAELEALVRKSEPVIGQGKDVERFTNFKDLLAAYFNVQEQIAKVGSDRARTRALVSDQFQPAFEKAQAAIRAIADNNNLDTQRSAGEIESSITTAQLVTMAGFLLALLAAVIGSWVLLRAIGVINKLVGQVQMSGIQVATSVTEISATSKEQQATASEIAATTTQIGATSKEISATSKELVKTMGDVSSVAEKTAVLAANGHAGLSSMEETMAHVMEAAASINAKLGVLNEKAGDINQVVITITKVADQTNLLSLNAAIEAEKAGESGRGFAVVAAEIRRLADQTGVATCDIEQLVKEVQSAISAGVMGMDKFSEEVRRGMKDVQQVGTQLSEIIQRVEALAPRFEQVNEGMQAQATGAEQISDALRQLTEAAQQTVESLRQSTLTIDELNHVSANLRGSVSSFRLQV
jgi:methyl-accepting chemotaxis protein WspA